MSDWDTFTTIGSKARGGPSQRETVVKSKSALNAAQRSGSVIATEKKFVTGNLSSKSGGDGQRMAMLDRTDDIVKPPEPKRSVGQAVVDGRKALNWTHKDLNSKSGVPVPIIKDIEMNRTANITDVQGYLEKIEKHLNVRLRGKNIGQPLRPPRQPKTGPSKAGKK